MRDDFAAFILTHGRPNDVVTVTSLRRHGYTGPIYLVIDDQDPAGAAYKEKFGDAVLEFSREEEARTTDSADNFGLEGVIYARNACFRLAKELGFRYFVQLDDDYTWFMLRADSNLRFVSMGIYDLDAVFEAFVRYLEETPRLTSVALSQGGDHIGGHAQPIGKRKAMNAFFMDVERPFKFIGRINEDVNIYVAGQRSGEMLFLTNLLAMLVQRQTQLVSGGMTELYLSRGTYVKSFYSVVVCPSAVRVGLLVDHDPKNRKPGTTESFHRLHHSIDWRSVTPMIVREKHRRE